MGNNPLGPRGWDALTEVLASALPALTHLALGGTSIGDVGVMQLSKGLRECKALGRLESQSNYISGCSIRYLTAALSTSEVFTHLDLRDNPLEHNESSARSIAELKALAYLDLRHCALGTKGIIGEPGSSFLV